LADVLLDVMGTKPGRIQIEETGLPVVELPAQISIWAASNPDEEPGPLEDIRRQLSDRFDFVIRMSRPSEIACVRQILAQSDGEADPPELQPSDQSRVSLFSTDLQNQCQTLGCLRFPDDIRGLIADIYTRFSLESLRAVEALQLGSKLNAAACVRDKVGLEDLITVTPLALRHRVDADTLGKILKYLQAWPSGAQNEVAGMQAMPPEPVPASRPTPPKPQPRSDPERKPSLWDRLVQKLAPPSLRQSGQPGVGASPQSTGKASLDGPRGGAGGAAAEGGIGDPSQASPVAPPFRARPVAEIPEKDLIKTEEDLAR
jgi:magnesium chelatase subunit I